MRRVVFNQKGGVASPPSRATSPPSGPSRALRTLVIDLDPAGQVPPATCWAASRGGRYGATDFFEQILAFSLRNDPVGGLCRGHAVRGPARAAPQPQLDELQAAGGPLGKIYKLKEALEAASPSYDAI